MRFFHLCLAFIAGLCSAQDKPIPTSADLFAWYDRLGLEDVSKAKFARIWTGQAVKMGGVRLEQDISHGFILEDRGDTFRAVLADLTLAIFKKAGDDPNTSDFCGYREASLKEEVERIIKALENPRYFERWERESGHFHYYDRLSRHAQVFILARESARRGHPEVAKELVNALARHPLNDGANRWRPFPEWLQDDLGGAMMWQVRLAYRDPGKTWADIRSMLQRVIDHCPDSSAQEGARSMAKNITALLDEDKTRHPGNPEDPEELVWRLHDEQNDKDTDDYWPRPYPFEPRKSIGVMATLRAKGNAAVPALIAELRRDQRPSRSASRSTRYGGGIWISDTHDLALQVLNDIAGFNFYWLIGWNTPEERSWARLLGAIDDWWRAVRRGDEREWLLEVVRRGGRKADAVADCLLARYPANFFDAAVSAVRESDDPDDPHPRNEMIDRLLKLKDPRTAAFLLEEMHAAETLGTKARFASALRQLGDIAGESLVIEELRKMKLADFERSGTPPPPTASPLAGNDTSIALTFLLESNSPAPFHFLAEKWPVLPFSCRQLCLEQLSRRNIRGDESESLPPAPEATQVAIRALLFLGLEDTTPQRGAIHTYDGGSIFEPRLCDLAAEALNGHWREQFEFDRAGVESKRERQRLTILNARFRELGRPELPLPMDRVKVPPESANILADVQWDEKSGTPDNDLRKEFASWIGKPISGGQLVQTICDYARSPERRKRRLELAILRDGDQTGVYIRVRQNPPADHESGVIVNKFITSAGEITLHSGGGSGDEKDWEDFERAADQALQSPPEKSFVIQASVGID